MGDSRRVQVFWKALGNLKGQDGVGTTPKGQRHPVRPYDSWREPDAISDPEALESLQRRVQVFWKALGNLKR